MREEHTTTQPLVSTLSSNLLKTVNELLHINSQAITTNLAHRSGSKGTDELSVVHTVITSLYSPRIHILLLYIKWRKE